MLLSNCCWEVDGTDRMLGVSKDFKKRLVRYHLELAECLLSLNNKCEWKVKLDEMCGLL